MRVETISEMFRVAEYSTVRNLKIPHFEYSHGVTLKTPINKWSVPIDSFQNLLNDVVHSRFPDAF